jgi:hypothetical protein
MAVRIKYCWNTVTSGKGVPTLHNYTARIFTVVVHGAYSGKIQGPTTRLHHVITYETAV